MFNERRAGRKWPALLRKLMTHTTGIIPAQKGKVKMEFNVFTKDLKTAMTTLKKAVADMKEGSEEDGKEG